MFLSAPGTRPEDNVNLQAYTVIDGSGKKYLFNWEKNSPEGVIDDAMITMVNSKSDFRMYNIYPEDSAIEIFGGHSRRSHFHWWNHWPASQITSDGRGARAEDRLAHSSLAWGAPGTYILLYGLTDKEPELLKMSARSWRTPPNILASEEPHKLEYNQGERAWLIVTDTDSISLSMEASQQQPVFNPAFVLKNRKAPIKKIRINDQVLEKKFYKTGFVKRAEGRDLIVWIDLSTQKPISIAFQ